MKEIKLTNSNKVALVDDNIYEALNRYKWREEYGYARRTSSSSLKGKVTCKTIRMHIAIMGKKKGFEIDHINRNALDNRLENLRFCTHQQNMSNSKNRKNNKYGFRGLVYRPKLKFKKWESYYRFNNKKYFCGNFHTKEEAALAYNKKATEIGGQFKVLNKM